MNVREIYMRSVNMLRLSGDMMKITFFLNEGEEVEVFTKKEYMGMEKEVCDLISNSSGELIGEGPFFVDLATRFVRVVESKEAALDILKKER